MFTSGRWVFQSTVVQSYGRGARMLQPGGFRGCEKANIPAGRRFYNQMHAIGTVAIFVENHHSVLAGLYPAFGKVQTVDGDLFGISAEIVAV